MTDSDAQAFEARLKLKLTGHRPAGGALLPDLVVELLLDYIARHRSPGGTLEALAAGDLFGFFERADSEVRGLAFELVTALQWYAPSQCYGSRAKVDEWLRRG